MADVDVDAFLEARTTATTSSLFFLSLQIISFFSSIGGESIDTFILLLLPEKMADVDVDTFILLLLSSYHLTVKRDAGAASIWPRAGFLRYFRPRSRSRARQKSDLT